MDVDGEGGGGSRANVSDALVAGDHPPPVSGLDFSLLFNASGDGRRGMAALQKGDRIFVALHKTAAWPKGIASDAPGGVPPPWEATHSVLESECNETGVSPASSLKLPPALKEVPEPAAPRPPVQQLTTAQHGSVVTPIFDVPAKGSPPWVDGFSAWLHVSARDLQTGLPGKVLFGLEGLQGCGKTLLLKMLQCIIMGPNFARHIKNLAQLLLSEFFQDHLNTDAVFTDEIDTAIFGSDNFKAFVDDDKVQVRGAAPYEPRSQRFLRALTRLVRRGFGGVPRQAQLKHANGVERHENYMTVYATWNPHQKPEKALALLAERGRRVVACAVAATLVSHGNGRKPGGHAGAEYFCQLLENQLNPWLNSGVYNFLTTGVHAPPELNLQQFGGNGPEEVARLRSILLYDDLSIADQFIKYWAALPEAQLPAEGGDWSKYVGQSGETPIQTANFFQPTEHTVNLAVTKHGLFQGTQGDKQRLNYEHKVSTKDDAGAFASVFNGIEEHGWQDGISVPAAFLKSLIDQWYKTRHAHEDGRGKTTVAVAVLKDLAEKKVLVADANDDYTMKRKDIATALKAAGVAPPPLAHAWFERERARNNAKLLADWWCNSEEFRSTSLRAFPAVFGLGGGAVAVADAGTGGTAGGAPAAGGAQ